MVDKCKEELKNCEQYCKMIAITMYNDRNSSIAYFIKCRKKLCIPSYEKCLEKSPIGRLLTILA